MPLDIPKRWAPFVSRLHDRLFCKSSQVMAQAGKARGLKPRSDAITVAIAHYNRGNLAHFPLCNLLVSDFVAEVLFFDDGSTPEHYANLQTFGSGLGCEERVRILRREKNCGAQTTKLDAVSAAKSEWVLILDSDNTVFPGFLEELSRLPQRNPQTFYCSPYAFPYFPFYPFSGQRLDFERCVALTHSGELRSVFIINDGNYLVHRESYMREINTLRELKSDVADVFVANYLWLSRGGELEVLERGAYHHRVDSSSFWMRTAEESRQRVIKLFKRMEDGSRWDKAFGESLMRP